MSGKSYTMREMKTIVDYLTEHNAYGEVKGRKMWMDFASSRLTNRTWQSLKETFLKRILPDITNPYYRLDVAQINSFKRGIDLTSKDKEKLEFEPVDAEGENKDGNDVKQPSNSHNIQENATGEDTTCSKVVHNRASTETLILENCYETAEDIQKDLERSTDDEHTLDKTKPTLQSAAKSVRDFIVYSEPLTPMLQEVLDDFVTDEESSDKEPQMEIDENYIPQEQQAGSPENAGQSQSILDPKSTSALPKTQSAPEQNKGEENDGQNSKKQVSETEEPSAKNNEESVFSRIEDVMVLVDEVLANELDPELNTEKAGSQDKVRSSNETSSVLTDTLLPNNQEAVNSGTFKDNSPMLLTNHDNEKPNTRKDSYSVDIIETNKDTHANIDDKSTSKLDEVKEKNQDEISPMNVETNKEQIEVQEPKSTLTLTNNENANILNGPRKSDPQKASNQNNTIVHDNDSEINRNRNDSSSLDLNPCLKSVSLYEEQFSSKKISDSDGNHKDNTTKVDIHEEKEEPKPVKKPKDDDIILLKSRSNTDSDDQLVVHRKPLARSSLKVQKDKTLASVFGFTNGNAGRSRRRSRKRTNSYRNCRHVSSDSSDWTSASDSDFVSPPRGHRNRKRKYLKPQSSRIMSLEEEGGLFVMLGKKIYPLVKDGKILKNYLTYLPESDMEEDESFWRNKYVEEKKRTAELKKLLDETKQNGARASETSSPALNAPPIQNIHHPPQREQDAVNGNRLVLKRKSNSTEKTPEEKLKVKFIKYGQEIQLEGQWQQIHTVLADAVSFLQPAAKQPQEDSNCVLLSSGTTTPTVAKNDPAVEAKINRIESEIFEEIKEKDKDRDLSPVENKTEINEVAETAAAAVDNSNVTIRKKRGRPKKNTLHPSSAPQTPAKKVKSDYASNLTDIEKDTVSSVRKTRVPKKLLDDNSDPASPSPQYVNGVTNAVTKISTRRKSTRKISENPEHSNLGVTDVVATTSTGRKSSAMKVAEIAENSNLSVTNVVARTSTRKKSTTTRVSENPEVAKDLESIEVENEDDEALYKFPSPPPEKRPMRRKSSSTKTDKETAKKHLQPYIRSPDNLSHHSINSSQGYQDSDASPFNIGIKKRRRISMSAISIKGRKAQRKYRSKSYPYIVDYTSSESSNSSFTIAVKSVTREQSTVNSEVYRSESYQLLVPLKKPVSQRLESINEMTTSEQNLITLVREMRNESVTEIRDYDGTAKNDAGSSSIVSLPLSPELSIVENLSIDKSALLTVDNHPTLNALHNNALYGTNDKYMISEIDVSMPLMGQECGLQKHLMSALDLSELRDVPNSAGRNLPTLDSSAMRISSLSESILSKICNANIAGSPSDSLDKRLEQLLLDSAQKPVANQNEQPMEVDAQAKKKTGSRKRCSTPNKRKTIEKTKKFISEEPIVEEESKATCSRSGRRSCPPSINIVYCENNAPENLEINIHDESVDVTTVTRRKSVKKDIIKVKILKPKSKPQKISPISKVVPGKCTEDVGDALGNTKGDNESGVFLHGFDDSTDLIHNHSETCLQIKDCLEDSVQYVEPSSESIISLSSSSLNEEDKENVDVGKNQEKETPEMFCENAQCGSNLHNAKITRARSAESGNTMYFTPFESPTNSILTEDLSDERPVSKPPKPRPSKWYLPTEEETNFYDINNEESNDGMGFGFGANLNHLFPITCAVPDLSTITETSEK